MRNMACITLLLFLLSASLASADNKKQGVGNYKKWAQLSSEELLKKGHYYYVKANLPDSAMLCYSIVANRYYEAKKNDKTQMQQSASAMNQIGILYTHYYFDYQKARSYLLMAQEIAEKYQFKRTLVNVFNNMCNLSMIDSSMSSTDTLYANTLLLHRKAFKMAMDLKDWYTLIPTTFNYVRLGDDEKREKMVVSDIKDFLKLNMPDSIDGKRFLNEFCQGMFAAANKNYDKALLYYDKAYADVRDRNMVTADIYRNVILNTKCRLLIKMGRDEEAVSMLYDMIEKAKEKNIHANLYVGYLALSGYYNKVGDIKKSEKYELLSLREKDLVMNQNKLQEASKTEFLFQINKMNEEMKQLSYDRRMQRIVIIGIAIFTLLLLYIAFLLYRRWRKTQATNRQLYQRTQDLLAVEEQHRQQLLDYEARLQELSTQPQPTPAAPAIHETQPQSPPAAPSVEPADVLQRPITPKYRTHQVSEEENSDLLHRILYVMETSDEIYDNAFSLGRLTELVDGRTANYVSQAINQHYHRNFSDMLNDYRIREACRRLNNLEAYSHLTNEALAETVGFRSYPNFVKNFKKYTGLTPSVYRKQVKESKINDK